MGAGASSFPKRRPVGEAKVCPACFVATFARGHGACQQKDNAGKTKEKAAQSFHTCAEACRRSWVGTTPCFAFDYQPGTNACYLNTHCDNSEIDRQQHSISCKRQTNAQTDNHCTSNYSGGVMDSSLASPNFTSLKAFCKAQRGPISTDDVNNRSSSRSSFRSRRTSFVQ